MTQGRRSPLEVWRTSIRSLLARLSDLPKSDRRDAALRQEVEHHLALLAAQFVQRGMSIDAACEAARREFGGVEQMKETYRDQAGWTWFADLHQDVWYALRTLRRNTGFAAVAVLTLALGIGANSAMFSVVNSVIVRPLPYADGERLVRLMMTLPAGDSPTGAPRRMPVGLTPTEAAEVGTRSKTLSHVGTAGPELVGLAGYEEAARLQGARISSSALLMLGVRPTLGRLFTAQDERAGAESVILIAYSAWQRYFGRDPEVLGRSLTLESVLGRRRTTRYTVVGVMPDGFEFPGAGNQFWMPFQLATGGGGTVRGPMLGRLADGASVEAATAELTPLIREIRQGQRGNETATYHVVREQDEIAAPVRPALLVLSIAVGFLLLIACINVANLLLARSTTRQREMGIRTALGAGRGRVIRLLLTESLLLASLGGLAAIAVAFGGVRLLRALATTAIRFDLGIGAEFPRLNEVAVDGSVLGFTCVTALLTGVVFGLAPALRQSRDAIDNLREGAASASSGLSRLGLRNVLVVMEIAAAMVLLVGAGLVVRSFANLSGVDPGYDASNVLTFQVSVPVDRYPDDRLRAFAEEVIARIRAVPGVDAVGYANQLPMVALRDTGGGLWRTADPARSPTPSGPDARLISHDYLRVMGIRLLAGRGLNEQDDAGRPRALLINEALARQEFPGEDALDRTVFIGRDPVPWQIVGIVSDVRQFGLDREPEPQFFVDGRQSQNLPLFPVGAYYAVRTAADPSAMVAPIRTILGQLDPQATLFNVAPMDRIVGTSIARPRMYSVLLGIFAAIGVTLAIVGIYGVMAYSVTHRTRELGIRAALGARRSQMMALVLRQSMVLTVTGISLGLGGAMAVTRYLEGMLFGITRLDAPTFIGVAGLFALVAGVASAFPARRAATVDPLIALRCD